jgi:hypothetical protein
VTHGGPPGCGEHRLKRVISDLKFEISISGFEISEKRPEVWNSRLEKSDFEKEAGG